MRSAFISVNVVRKRQQITVEVIGILKGNFNRDVSLLSFHVDWIVEQDLLAFVEIFDVVFDPARIMKFFSGRSFRTFVFNRDF